MQPAHERGVVRSEQAPRQPAPAEPLEDWPAIADLLPALRGVVRGNALLGPMIDRVEGEVLRAAGEIDAGHALIRRAVEGFRGLKAPFEERHGLELLSVFHGRTVDRSGP